MRPTMAHPWKALKLTQEQKAIQKYNKGAPTDYLSGDFALGTKKLVYHYTILYCLVEFAVVASI